MPVGSPPPLPPRPPPSRAGGPDAAPSPQRRRLAHPDRKIDLARAVYIDENGTETKLSKLRQAYRDEIGGEPPQWLLRTGFTNLFFVPESKAFVTIDNGELTFFANGEGIFRNPTLKKMTVPSRQHLSHEDTTPITRGELSNLGYREALLRPSVSVFGPKKLHAYVRAQLERVLGGSFKLLAARDEVPHPLSIVLLPTGKNWRSMPQVAEHNLAKGNEEPKGDLGRYIPTRKGDWVFAPADDIEAFGTVLAHELDHYDHRRMRDQATNAEVAARHAKGLREGLSSRGTWEETR
ncbi:MAG: hypothetical protein ACKVPX_16460 [Myxococcaceae bacterium]